MNPADKVEKWAIDKLVPYARNARTHSDEQVGQIAASIKALGGKLQDVVRTRVYLQNAADCEAVSRVHGKYFGAIRPANTLLEVSALIGEGYLVEIEAEAVVAAGAA